MSPHHGVKNSKTSTWETGDYFNVHVHVLNYMDNALQQDCKRRQQPDKSLFSFNNLIKSH